MNSLRLLFFKLNFLGGKLARARVWVLGTEEANEWAGRFRMSPNKLSLTTNNISRTGRVIRKGHFYITNYFISFNLHNCNVCFRF